GVIQAYAYARNGINGVASPDEVWARGYIQDDFIVTGAAPGTPLSLMAYFTVNGVFSGNGGIAEVTPPENAAVIARIAAAQHNQEVQQWARTETQMGDCWQWGCPGWSTPFHRQFALELNVTAGVPFQIYYYLEVHAGWAYGGSGGTADFANTARLNFALPTGTSIDSVGGFSQTSDPQIPEPASILLTGVALLALATRRLAIA
ncbi:MAG: PEP-CTERM sorting domain-containing protein, partial [Bryobacterales bacterium]|nr:PEP-CTERM sorting domain-containing protein [Bryobacterales bacterium]